MASRRPHSKRRDNPTSDHDEDVSEPAAAPSKPARKSREEPIRPPASLPTPITPSSSSSSRKQHRHQPHKTASAHPQASPLDPTRSLTPSKSSPIYTRALPLASSPNDFDASSPLHPRLPAGGGPVTEVRIDYADGSYYFGLAVHDPANGKLMRHGRGTLYDRGKDKTYVGEFVCNIKHGYGSTKYHSRAQLHQGEYRRGLRHGPGSLIFAATGDVYEGEFCVGKVQGAGRYTWKDGSSYEGEFVEGRMTAGRKKCANGDEFEGAFDEKGQAHGFVNARLANGDVLCGEFVDGVPHGRGRLVRDRARIDATFVRGKPVGLTKVVRGRTELVVTRGLQGGLGAKKGEGFFEVGLFDGSGKICSGAFLNNERCLSLDSWQDQDVGARTELVYALGFLQCIGRAETLSVDLMAVEWELR